VDGRRGVAVEPAKELIGRRAPDRLRILRDDGDRRVEHAGERDVVEADQRDLAFATGVAKGADAADREQVLPGEEGGRRLRQCEQLVDRASSRLGVPQLGADQAVVDLDVSGSECLLIAMQPFLRRRDREQVAEKADLPMAAVEEVGDRLGGAAEVVGDDAVGVEVAGRTVDEDERRPGPPLLVEVPVVVAGGSAFSSQLPAKTSTPRSRAASSTAR
jgi:hypothetical protein